MVTNGLGAVGIDAANRIQLRLRADLQPPLPLAKYPSTRNTWGR